ncbi:hypothetical protein ASE26_11055 [Duganella sp. Root198D2]|nr:hypothetical protein ASE26_11055 [Duganella sp. Root198D2]
METMQRVKALTAVKSKEEVKRCSGQVFIGMFFDGTGNNREIDFVAAQNDPSQQKHSNVVRLFHTFRATKEGADKYYAGYVPGVGTPFKDISDTGGKMGKSMSWNGEKRIVWSMFEVLNFISRYVSDDLLLPRDQQNNISNNLGGLGSMAILRNSAFNVWTSRLKTKIEGRRSGYSFPEQINLSVFGFSRGAAEARAFVNWLFDICEERNGQHYLAGVPLHVNFLGIFDTVASVGIANAYAGGLLAADGHQSWADDNMQVHASVQNCLHIVAAHEVRSTFPMDSVRINGSYPPNTTEYVYPGAHSDVGGGYSPGAQGKTDQLARIAGFEMYCAALAAGVPLNNVKELDVDVRNALLPSQAAVDAFNSYMAHAKVRPAPVEEMLRQHMAHYFTYRYQARFSPGLYPNSSHYYSRKFYKKATAERECLRDSQQHFMAIIGLSAERMEKLQKEKSWGDHPFPQPFRSIFNPKQEDSQIPVLMPQKLLERGAAIVDSREDVTNDILAYGIQKSVEKWHKWLEDNDYAYLVDEDAPERDILSVLRTLSDVPQPREVVEFIDHWVHDSMAGLAFDGMNEFLANGTGLAKFRRVYFGDDEDEIVRNAASEANDKAMKIVKAKRHEKKQWKLDAAEFARTRS